MTVDPNIVGLTTNGGAALPNGGDGVLIDGNAHGNTIGGTQRSVIPQNTFSGNAGYGLVITGWAHDNLVFRSYIGTALLGVTALGNQRGGVLVGGHAYLNAIGNFSSRPSNIISGNRGNGVTLLYGTRLNRVINNFIGRNRLGIRLPNTGRPILNLGRLNLILANRTHARTARDQPWDYPFRQVPGLSQAYPSAGCRRRLASSYRSAGSGPFSAMATLARRWSRLDVPTIVLGQGRVAQREAEHELDPAHAVEQVVHARGVPAALAHALIEAERPVAPGLVIGRGAAGGAAADQRPGAGRGSGRDQLLMLALHRRVGDLEHLAVPWPRTRGLVTFAPVRPRGRVWIAMTARYRPPG